MAFASIRSALLVPLAVLIVCLCVFCGTREAIEPLPAPETVSKLINEDGDTISLGPVTVWIPAGALDSAVTITVTEVWSLPVFPANYTRGGYGYAVEPHGLTFNVPIVIEIEYDTMLVGPVMMRLDSLTDNTWEQLGAVIFDDGTATLQTTQLSVIAIARFSALTNVYVANSSRGSFASGTSRDPLPTLAEGIAASLDAGEPYPTVHVSIGLYEESPTFQPGVDIVGGLDSLSWNPVSGSYSVFLLGATSASAQSVVTGTQISGLHLLADDAPDGLVPARSSIALSLNGCSEALEFSTCRFEAGSGADGAPGADGQAGVPGAAGIDGYYLTGGAGGGGVFAGGRGGNGRDWSLLGESGYTGEGPAGGAGGLAGNWGSGSSGGTGGPGADGPNGYGGTSAGSYSSDGWTPSLGEAGNVGMPGSGGGGGGAGSCQSGCSYGCSGGGGGGGGSAGQYGLGGYGGGSSFAVYLFESSPKFTNCQFASAGGGNGGTGGNGGSGGSGGSGGAGCTDVNSEPGGNGGRGGDGGSGGGGQGGPGGHSFCICAPAPSAPFVINADFAVGSVGTGGPGGLQGGDGPPAATGASGTSAETGPN